jgi:DNA-binding NarL/FixJ family response regulator
VVFPSTKIVALTSSPKQMIASLKAGAAIALPRSTPASVLTRLVTRLLAKPIKAKPVKKIRLQTHQTSASTRH